MIRMPSESKISFVDLFHQRVSNIPPSLTSYTDSVLYLKGLHDGMFPFCRSLDDIEDLDVAYTACLKSLFSGESND